MKTRLNKQFNRSSARILTRGRIPFFAFLVILATGSFALADATYDDNSLPAANIVTGSSGVGNVTIDISGTKSYGYVISGNGTLTKTGSGELTLTKQNTVSGGVTVNNGTLTLTYTGGTGALPKGSVITVDGSTSVLQGSGTILGYGTGGAVGRLNLNNGGSINVTSGHITMGCVMYLNNGKFTIANPTDQGDDYGNYIIDNGIHVTGGINNEIAANRISIRNDSHSESGGLFDISENAQLTVKAVIFDSKIASDLRPNVVKKGKGVLVFSAANTYSKDTSIEAGTIRLTDNGTLGSATSEITVTSSAANMYATLELAQTSGEINFTRNIKSNYYSNAATGGNQTGRLIKSGAATLNFSGNISSTGFETSAGITNFGTAAAPNTNGLRLGYLRVDNGATVNYNGGTNGTMTILGGGTSFVGKTGNGTLNINSGKVGTEATSANLGNLKLFIGGETKNDKNSVGTVNIASGVTYNAGSQEINVGSWGTGYLNIYGTMTTSALLRLAEHSGGSKGTITVYDGGSLTSNTNLFVGSYGEGLVDVKNGGSVTAKGSVTVGSNGNGTILVENGGRFTSTVNIKLAAIAGQSGTITVQNGGYLKSQDIQVGSNGTGLVNNYGTIEVIDTVKLGRDGSNGSGTFNVYSGATLSANAIFPGVTMPGTLNIAGGTVTANDVAMHGRGTNATGAVTITNGGSLTANLLQFGNVNYTTYAVDTTLTLDDGTLSVVNVTYPREGGSHTNNVNATVNLGKGTVITGAAPGVESIWWKSVHINLTSANGTEFQVDAGKQALINSTMSGSGKLIKTGEGTLLINAAEGEVDIQSLLVSSGRLDMKEYYTGALEVGLPDDADSTAIFSPGNSVGSLEITGNFILNSGATLLMEFDNTGTDSLLVSGTTTFEEGSILSLAMGEGTSVSPNQQISFQLPIGISSFDNAILDYPSFLTNLKYNSTTGILSATVDANAVPEPSTWALLVLGVIVLFLRKRVRS
ncbi:MAG: autotransporter-associated beta strand repeat-containing protein [Thermoguttaceae bacterium]|nr:autotransporter-associated beta strand repeat-containing protein [Thermoguttaceae bacterium]